ncbi:MAG: hypothetical protein J5382_11470 [Bacteroidales bacterium]|nr:hypothetical protein [Bacteroidales bacterium]
MFTTKQTYTAPEMEFIEVRLGTTIMQTSLTRGAAGGDDEIVDDGDLN